MTLSRTTKNDRIIITAVVIILFLFSMVALYFFGELANIISIVLALAILLMVVFDLYRRSSKTEDLRLEIIKNEMVSQTHQVEALFSIHAFIKPVLPLPKTMGFAASPDFLSLIIETIIKNKPNLVFEAGSGVSTLITAYCLKRIGKGKIISLEHDKKYALESASLIASHGLEGFVEIIHAPLIDIELNGVTWKWYDIQGINIDMPIDILVVDGPPRSTQSLARYPALPILKDKLGNEFRILLDDAQRKDEQKAVARWKDEYPGLDCKYLELQKGAFLIRDVRV
ncbi:MAG: class I SAM-dependent methyltransferase [Candidatus Scalindua sp.]